MIEVHDYSPEEVCAMLTIKACPKSMFPQMSYSVDFKNDVQQRLLNVGYELVNDPISSHYDARILRSITESTEFREGDFPSCQGFTIPAKALLVILWCNLILPLLESRIKGSTMQKPHVTEDQLFENFKLQWGSRQNLRKSLTTLKQYGFIQVVRGTPLIVAGPRLSTSIENFRLLDHIRNNVIDLLVSETEEEESEDSFSISMENSDQEEGELHA